MRLVWAALAGASLAGVAGADPAGAPLAAAGACAEPRAELQTAPDQAGLVDDFEVAGTPAHHFTPTDVAGGPGGGPQPPGPNDLPPRDPCDKPNGGCGLIVPTRRIEEQPPDPDPLPVDSNPPRGPQ
jgi:hypothetical protein